MESVPLGVTHLISPFTLLCAAPTMSGKSHWIGRLIRRCRSRIYPPIDRVIYVFSQNQPFFQELAKSCPVPILFTQDLDNLPVDPSKATFLVIDDYMSLHQSDHGMEAKIAEYFIKKAHHQNVSVAYLVQNLFNSSKVHRTISLNSQYLWLGKNPRAIAQIQYLATQMYPGKTYFLREAYKDATLKPYGYLFLDFKQNTPEKFRVRTDILDGEPIVYVMKSDV